MSVSDLRPMASSIMGEGRGAAGMIQREPACSRSPKFLCENDLLARTGAAAAVVGLGACSMAHALMGPVPGCKLVDANTGKPSATRDLAGRLNLETF